MLPVNFVKRPTVEEIICLISDEAMPAHKFVSKMDEREIHKTRMEIDTCNQQGNPMVICACCHTPVKLRSSFKGNHYFKHYEKPEKPCPYQDGGGLDAQTLDQLRFNGLKEGYMHRRMKELIEISLRADKSFQLEEYAQERIWKSTVSPSAWRRPDVRAVSLSHSTPLQIAFEAQLSSTYLHVIADRRQFYLEENALLFWIFSEAQDSINPRCFEKDLFYNNNSNLFIVDEETCRLSEEKYTLMLRCRYLVPCSKEGKVIEEWSESIVSFTDLTVEVDKQRVWYYDTEGELNKVNKENYEWDIEQNKIKQAALRSEFEAFWLEKGHATYKQYRKLRLRFSEYGIELPDNFDTWRFNIILNVLYSAKLGRVIGYSYEKLVEVAHNTAEKYPEYMRYFAEVVAEYGTKHIIRKQDLSGKWSKRAANIWQKIKDNDSQYAPDMTYAALVQFLFPCCNDVITNDGDTRFEGR